MARYSRSALLSMIQLSQDSTIPKFRQLGSQLRKAILCGQLKTGTKLPSTRELALTLGISRLTVQNTYEQLIAEGYLEAKTGSGTFVTPLSSSDLSPDRPDTEQLNSEEKLLNRLSERGANLQASYQIVHHQTPRPFHPGTPALDQFPVQTWTRISGKHWRGARSHMLNYGDPHGYMPLRKAIAGYLRDARGVNCDEDQIIVVSGAQQAFCLCTWALMNEGDSAWVEDPGHIAARQVMQGAGARIIPVPIDEEGIDIKAGLKLNSDPKMIMVTPSHQHPLGITTSLSRRLELLQLAYRTGAWLIEDDYDSEFRFKDRPLTAMQGLDEYNHVIYIGTFSKVLFPSLRLAYLVVPKPLVESFANVYSLLDRAAPTMPQAILADVINEGHFTAHIRKMRNLYFERQQALLEVLNEYCLDLIRPVSSDSGMHLIGWLPKHLDDKAVSAKARELGVDVIPLSIYSIQVKQPPAILIGFSCVDPKEMPAAAKLLAKAIRSLL
jgi:GntR family transcriptional regulator/MocR family aminotransferase